MKEQLLSVFIYLFWIPIAFSIIIILAKHVIVPIFKKYYHQYSLTKTDVLFIRFLKKNKAYKKFMRYKTDINWKRGGPCEYISRAFLWKPTKEGVEYWYGLHNKWKRYLSEHETINIESHENV